MLISLLGISIHIESSCCNVRDLLLLRTCGTVKKICLAINISEALTQQVFVHALTHDLDSTCSQDIQECCFNSGHCW